MSLQTFMHNGLVLSYYDNGGTGVPLIVQHGLTANYAQAKEVYPDGNYRCITLECRGHGNSDSGDIKDWSIETFTEDLRALLDHLDIKRAIFSGISMGAAMSLAFASCYPEYVVDLVLIRPSWSDKSSPENMLPFKVVADLIELYGTENGLERYKSSDALAKLSVISPDNTSSLLGMFNENPNIVVPMLRAISSCEPIINTNVLEKRGIIPTCVYVERDYIHPFSKVNEIAQLIPNTRIIRSTTKSEDKQGYIRDCKAVLSQVIQG